MRATKLRQIIGGIVAIAMIVVFGAIGATVILGWNIPVLTDIVKALGLSGGAS